MIKKRLISTLLALSIPFTTPLRAEEAPAAEQSVEKPPVKVGKGAADGASTSRHKNLGNITIAVLAIVVAATAIILVSKHDGKHS